uniref:Galectin n=1 Tax=Panagrolaimus davidi TaxID=227884 RepID=A0A914PDI0_9BILA
MDHIHVVSIPVGPVTLIPLYHHVLENKIIVEISSQPDSSFAFRFFYEHRFGVNHGIVKNGSSFKFEVVYDTLPVSLRMLYVDVEQDAVHNPLLQPYELPEQIFEIFMVICPQRADVQQML